MSDHDAYAEHYKARYGFEAHLVRIRRRRVVKLLQRYGANAVVEVGCGTESLAVDYPAGRFVVVEPSAAFVEQARATAPAHVQWFTGTAQDYFEAPWFAPDAVVLSSLLHELKDPEALLASVVSATRSARPVIHINVPNALSMHVLLGHEMGLLSDVKDTPRLSFRAQRAYVLADLTALVTAAGLRVLDSGSWFIKPFTHPQMQDILGQGILPPSVVDALDALTSWFPDHGAEIYVDAQVPP
jgi:trans-aconitate methyltransferase